MGEWQGFNHHNTPLGVLLNVLLSPFGIEFLLTLTVYKGSSVCSVNGA